MLVSQDRVYVKTDVGYLHLGTNTLIASTICQHQNLDASIRARTPASREKSLLT